MPVTLYLVRCNIGTLLLRLEVLEIGLLALLGLLPSLLELEVLFLLDSSLLAIRAGRFNTPVLFIYPILEVL